MSYPVSIEEQDAYAYERTLCQACRGEQRKAAHDEETAAFVGYPTAGSVCRPCAIFLWGSDQLRSRVPMELLEPEDSTLTDWQLAMSTSAAWTLAGRMPVVEVLT